MITGFEQQTHDLTEKEIELVPGFVNALKLRIGKENAISNIAIRKAYEAKGIKINDARVRKIINHIRIRGLVPLLCSSKKGYFVAENLDEINEYLQGLKERIEAQTTVFDAIEFQLKSKQ